MVSSTAHHRCRALQMLSGLGMSFLSAVFVILGHKSLYLQSNSTMTWQILWVAKWHPIEDTGVDIPSCQLRAVNLVTLVLTEWKVDTVIVNHQLSKSWGVYTSSLLSVPLSAPLKWAPSTSANSAAQCAVSWHCMCYFSKWYRRSDQSEHRSYFLRVDFRFRCLSQEQAL